jgi:hypothetical protein
MDQTALEEKLTKYLNMSEKQLLTLILIELQSIHTELQNIHTREELDFSLGILQKEIQVVQRGVVVSGRVAVYNDNDDGYEKPLKVSER